MVEVLPTTIPFCAVNLSYSEAPERNVVTFKPAVGRAKERRRTSIASMLSNFQRSMTTGEWEILKAFYRITLKDGVLEFQAPHPFKGTGVTGTFIFQAEPRMSSLAPGKVMVQISLLEVFF